MAKYRNEFFEGKDPNSSFVDKPMVSNLTKTQIWKDQAKFYFLPFLINCYKFTQKHDLPHFTLMCSPTFIFYRDRLSLRCYMDTIHQAFFRAMDMCGVLKEPIMLLVEKRFHIFAPIDGGTQQLYNMLWDVDLTPVAKKCYLPPLGAAADETTWTDPNPGMTDSDLWLSRKTLWLQDDLNFLCTKFNLDGEYESQEILDLSNIPDEKKDLYKPRTFYFKTFSPIIDSSDTDLDSSDTALDDSSLDEFDFDSTQTGMLDSTLSIEQDDKEMNKIIAFFANMTKVTGLIQGMLDMMAALTRILPLVAQKMDKEKEEDVKLIDAITKTVNIVNLGIDKVMKICRFLGIKAEKKPSGAIALIVKDRFKKNKKDFIDYEIDELNKSLDALNDVDTKVKPIPPGPAPVDVTPNNTYPQKLEPHHQAPIIHLPPDKEDDESKDSTSSTILSVQPEPPPKPPKDENGIK